MCVALVACRTGVSTDAHCRDAQHPSGPAAAALAYADALEQGQLDAAYALLDPQAGESEAAFRARYADPTVRAARARQLRASTGELRLAGTPVSVVDREGWRVIDGGGERAQGTLRDFLSAVDAGDFAGAYALLSGGWRAQYTPAAFAQDFRAEPLAKERLSRARAALEGAAPRFEGDAVLFPIGEGKAVRLVREDGTFRVAALE